MQTFLIILSAIFLGYGCSQIARRQGRNPTIWFILGVLFGLLALIVIALLPASKQKRAETQTTPEPKLVSLKTLIESHTGKLWYYLGSDQTQFGPMSLDALSREWREGKVSEKTLVWNEELTEWKQVTEILRPE